MDTKPPLTADGSSRDIRYELDPVFAVLASLTAASTPPTSPRLSPPHAAPLLAQVKQLNRAANLAVQARKARTAEARQEMDMTQLEVQNLMYEKEHLVREIERCLNFASIYQDIPLYPTPDFFRLAPPSLQPPEVSTSEHALMLARLNFELAERYRLDAHKKELETKREELQQESKAFSQSLNALRQQLDAMAKSSAEIQKKIHELSAPPPALSTTPQIVVEEEEGRATFEGGDVEEGVKQEEEGTPAGGVLGDVDMDAGVS